MAKEASTLKLGYPPRAKWLLFLPMVGCSLVVWRTYAHLSFAPSLWDIPVFLGLLLAGLPAVYGMRSRTEVDREGLTKFSLWRSRRFSREDFLSHERIAREPGETPDLLLRFKTGVAFLGASEVDQKPEAVIQYLNEQWGVNAADYKVPELGAVNAKQSFEYEPLHATMLLIVGLLTFLVAVRIPVFGLLAIVSALCFRAAWRAMGKLDTNEEGLTFTHRFRPAVSIGWNEIDSAAYWNSFAQGGVKIRGKAGQTIRVYCWIGGYPLLDRLLHDRLSNQAFWPTLQLPMRVDLNRRRRLGVLLPYVVLMSNALVLLWQGNFGTFAFVSLLPTFVAAALIFGSSRVLEFDKDGVKDVWRYMWFRKVNRFDRTALVEARLGRQLTVGGLWMKFGEARLEIANSEVSLPPEQILTCLRQARAWQAQPESQAPGSEQRAA